MTSTSGFIQTAHCVRMLGRSESKACHFASPVKRSRQAKSVNRKSRYQSAQPSAMLARSARRVYVVDVVVDEVSKPQISDRRSRFSFFRSSKHEQVARQRWLGENSTAAYIGLWHTHPERDPTPSVVDQRDWKQAVAGDTYEGDRLFFPIVGTHCIRVWTLSRRGTFRELKLENNNAQSESIAEPSLRTRAGCNGD